MNTPYRANVTVFGLRIKQLEEHESSLANLIEQRKNNDNRDEDNVLRLKVGYHSEY